MKVQIQKIYKDRTGRVLAFTDLDIEIKIGNDLIKSFIPEKQWMQDYPKYEIDKYFVERKKDHINIYDLNSKIKIDKEKIIIEEVV